MGAGEGVQVGCQSVMAFAIMHQIDDGVTQNFGLLFHLKFIQHDRRRGAITYVRNNER